MFLKNCWYVAAWGHEVAGDGLLSRKILGEQVLLYRQRNGEAAALIDRCSHRFAPLSKGRREGDYVRCMYHGLVFNADGLCVEEPGRDQPSDNTSIRSYPLVEKYKMLWIWMGDAQRADPSLIPDCHWQDDPAWRSIPAYIHYEADYRLIMDNQLDFSHLSFVHENTLGGSRKIAETVPTLEAIEGGIRLTRWYLNEPEIAPYLRGVVDLKGAIDRWHIYDWFTGGNVLNMDSGSAPAGTGAPQGHRAPQSLQFHATQCTTPEDEHCSHFFWTYAHNFNLNDPAFTKALAGRIEIGFVEDREMIEAQQKVVDVSGDDKMAFISVDLGLTQGRRLLNRAIAAEQAAN